MPLHNVSATHHEHSCIICGAQKQQAHTEIEQVQTSRGITLVIECANGHRECFNMELTAEDEQTGSDVHKHQAQQIRALQKHLGLPLVEERNGLAPSPVG